MSKYQPNHLKSAFIVQVRRTQAFYPLLERVSNRGGIQWLQCVHAIPSAIGEGILMHTRPDTETLAGCPYIARPQHPEVRPHLIKERPALVFNF